MARPRMSESEPMADQGEPVRIAVNVMRARLTVVGFNLAIATFQLSSLRGQPGGVPVPGTNIAFHGDATVALLLGLGLSVIAMVAFIGSAAFDQQGTCTHWSLLAGDLFMYLGLAHNVAGLFGPTLALLSRVPPDTAAQAAELEMVRIALVTGGGVAWLATMYVGPIVSLLRSPFGWRANYGLGGAYLALVLALAHVSGQASHFEAARGGSDAGPPPTLLNELLQPLRWGVPVQAPGAPRGQTLGSL